MAIELIVEVPIRVSTSEQASQILASVESGLAEVAIKDRVLFGGSAPDVRNVEHRATNEPSLTRVETKARKANASTEESVQQPKERIGLIGRRPIKRRG